MAFAGFLPHHLGVLLVLHLFFIYGGNSLAGRDSCSTQYFAMHFKTLNSSCKRVSERTDHEDEWTFCSDYILALFSYDYSETAKVRAWLLTSNLLGNGELHLIYDAMYT